jgi:ABC-type molybdenum transport system ATPase subunit/photorepair protein PhrA
MTLQRYVEICMPHTQAHIDLMGQDRMHQNELEALQKRLGGVKNNMQQIDAIVEQGQQHIGSVQSAQQTAQTKDQIKLQQAQSEIAIDRAMAAAKIKNQNIKAMSTISTNQQKASAKIATERQKLQQQVGAANIATSPIQPAAPGMGEPELGAEEVPFA